MAGVAIASGSSGDAGEIAQTRLRRRIEAKTDDQFVIFLSHRKPDTALAREIKLRLQELAPNLVVWCAEADIRTGARWFESIRDAARAADLFLLAYTAEEWRWDWCNWEAGLFDRAEDLDEPIVVLRSPGLKLPDPLRGYQGLEATAEKIQEFLVDLLLGDTYLTFRPEIGPLSSASRDRISEIAQEIEVLMSTELRSGYIPHQLTVRWDPSDELNGIPSDALVEADEETRVLFRVRVADETAVTWEELTAFHRAGEHVHIDETSGRWLDQLDAAVVQLNQRKNPEPLSWRFRGHQRMGLFRPYLYKFERRDGRLASISILLLAEDSPRKVGGHRYNMLRSCERTHTEIVEQLRDDRTSLVDPGLDETDWGERRDQLRESIMMVRNEEATIEPFEHTRCQVVFGEYYARGEIGDVLQARDRALESIAVELSKPRDQFDQKALSAAVDEVDGSLAALWPAIADAYAAAVREVELGQRS